MRRSMTRRLVAAVLVGQLLALSGFVLLFFLLMTLSSDDKTIGGAVSNDIALPILVDQVALDPAGVPYLKSDYFLESLKRRDPGFWYVVRIAGHEFRHGTAPVPDPLDVPAVAGAWFGALRLCPDLIRCQATFEEIKISPYRGKAVLGGIEGSPLNALLNVGFIINRPVMFLVFVVLTALFTALTTWLGFHVAMRSVHRLAGDIQSVDIEAPEPRLVSVDVPAEFQPLVDAFNGALLRIRRNTELQREMLGDAAHELRTPVAVLMSLVEELPAGPARSQIRGRFRELDNLLGQLLDAERFRRGVIDLQPLDLGALAAGVLADLAPYASRAGYTVQFAAPDQPCWIRGDEFSLQRLITNLVMNAIRHAGGAGTIEVAVRPDAALEVRDEGPGLPPGIDPADPTPFRRGRVNAQGTGLGFSLVARIAAAHGGSMSHAATGPGTTIRVNLPQLATR